MNDILCCSCGFSDGPMCLGGFDELGLGVRFANKIFPRKSGQVLGSFDTFIGFDSYVCTLHTFPCNSCEKPDFFVVILNFLTQFFIQRELLIAQVRL